MEDVSGNTVLFGVITCMGIIICTGIYSIYATGKNADDNRIAAINAGWTAREIHCAFGKIHNNLERIVICSDVKIPKVAELNIEK